jgi:hypothetical protein
LWAVINPSNPEPESISDDCTKLDHMHQLSLAIIIIRIVPALKHLVSACASGREACRQHSITSKIMAIYVHESCVNSFIP